MKQGSFMFVLHSHLPYVLSHGVWPHGQDWLNEASAEAYIPLLKTFWKLYNEGIKGGITIGITPILAEQLKNEEFKDDFINYLKQKINFAIEDEKEFSSIGDKKRILLARMWQRFYEDILNTFENEYKKDILGEFKKLQDNGFLEIITCAATHGYLPLLSNDNCIYAQIKLGVEAYKENFGIMPVGIWLPECAYRPGYLWRSPFGGEAKERKGIEKFLADVGLKYFIVDSHMLKGGKAIGVYLARFKQLKDLWKVYEKSVKHKKEISRSPYNVYIVDLQEENYVSVFTRDPKTGLQVWSGEYGYPGDGFYLDFHKKHFPGGHRYWRVTSSKADLGEKVLYEPHNTKARIKENAEHFVSLVEETLSEHYQKTKKAGILTAPFDTELFGHWWFEGPQWIYHVIKLMKERKKINLTTGKRYLEQDIPEEIISLPEGSWGEGGFHWIWLNDWTFWTWKYIYDVEEKTIKYIEEFKKHPNKMLERILKQMIRELLLIESSDWQFLITTWSARDYAEQRVILHYENFKTLCSIFDKAKKHKNIKDADIRNLERIEKIDNIFPNLDISWWS